MFSCLSYSKSCFSKAVHKNTHTHFPACYTLPPLFFERGRMLLRLSNSDVSWFCMAAVTPVYKAAM